MLTTLKFKVEIPTDRETVWNAMLNQETYRIWTEPFCVGSYYEGSWEKGARIRFLGPGGSGGMTSIIADNRLHEFISIRHLGEIIDGVEDTESEKVQKWAGAHENYTFRDISSGENTMTEVVVELQITPEFLQYMNEAWPKALEKLKEVSLAESRR